MVHHGNSLFTGSLEKTEVGINYYGVTQLDQQLFEKLSVLLTFRSLGWWWVQASNMAANRSPVPTNTASTLGMSMQICWLVLVPSGFTAARMRRLLLTRPQMILKLHWTCAWTPSLWFSFVLFCHIKPTLTGVVIYLFFGCQGLRETGPQALTAGLYWWVPQSLDPFYEACPSPGE